MPTGASPGDPGQRFRRAQMQLPFVLLGQHGIELVNPAMQSDLVPFGDDAPLFVRVEQRGDGGHEEGGRNARLPSAA